MTTLRDRLRLDTAPCHERVDQAYSTLDLGRPGDLAAFLSAQRSVLRALRLRPGPQAGAAGEIASRMAAALDADLTELDASPGPALRPREVDAMAAHYVLLGSSLGTRVLHRRWTETRDPGVAGAGRYLGLAMPPGAWRALCGMLARRPSDDAEADAVVRDAIALFDLHLAAWDARAALCDEGFHA